MWRPIFSHVQLQTEASSKQNPKIPNDLPGSRKSQYQSFCIEGITAIVNVHVETRSIQQENRCLPTILGNPETLCTFSILSYKESSEKSSNNHSHNNSNNLHLGEAKPRT